MLDTYEGTLLLVSHDRDFLDRVVTSVVASDGDGVWTEYAGGYSDMVAQRGYGIGGKPAKRSPTGEAKRSPGEAARGAAPPSSPPASARRRLTYSDQHALKTLPAKIATLTSDVARFEAALADPGLYARDPAAFARTSAALAAARSDLAKAEEDWLRIEMLREEIEMNGATAKTP
jgi:ATP-binding cassette subfamily F protein uup